VSAKILGYTYRVDRAQDIQELGAMGDFNANKQIIRIAGNLHSQQAQSTMIHEMIEAINYALELKLEHNAIQSLEAGLYQALIDNGVDLTPLEGL
jgi:bifunctional DNase/RNase